jgi:hypothetical protein
MDLGTEPTTASNSNLAEASDGCRAVHRGGQADASAVGDGGRPAYATWSPTPLCRTEPRRASLTLGLAKGAPLVVMAGHSAVLSLDGSVQARTLRQGFDNGRRPCRRSATAGQVELTN